MRTGCAAVAMTLAILSAPAVADDLDALLGEAPSPGIEEEAAPAGKAPPRDSAPPEATATGPSEAPGAADDVAASPPAARPAAAIEEIVVTAQRREESLQDVPISVTAFGAEAIEQRDITSFADVAATTPGFVYTVGPTQPAPTIRGLGADRYTISTEPGVAFYVDDIYYGRSYLPQAALTQIERIEVLRGPQGTLYGRNTSGGALKIVSKRPSDELEASGGLQYGSFDQVVAQGSVSGPVLEGLAGRLSFYGEDRDGYIENRTLNEMVDAHQVLSGRGSARYEPLGWLRLHLSADLTRQDDTGPVGHAVTPLTFGFGDSTAPPAFAPYDAVIRSLEEQFGVVLDPLRDEIIEELAGGRVSRDPRVVFHDAPSFTKIDSQGLAATLDAMLGGVDAKLISGYLDSRRDWGVDGDLTDAPGLAFVPPNFTSGRQASAELQLSSTIDRPWLRNVHWLAGAFFYDEAARERITIPFFLLGPDQLETLGPLVPPEIVPLFQSGGLARAQMRTTQDVRSVAGFADAEWGVFDWLRLHLGGRYTADHKMNVTTFENPDPQVRCQNARGSESWDAFTLRTGADVPWDDDRLFYVSFSQGFKAGGFNPVDCNAAPYDPEHVDAIELGIKSQWFDRRFRINAAGFFYDFTDIQVEKVIGLSSSVLNAATAEIRGAEVEMNLLVLDDLSLDAGLGWLDARYTEFFDDDPFTQADDTELDLSGNRLNKSPEWTGSIGLQGYRGIGSLGELIARAEWSYTDSMFFDHFNHDFARGPSYHLWNLFLNFDRPDGRYGLQAFVKNLADELYYAGQFTPSALVGGPYTYFGVPRTWGVELHARF